jgi:hypothetical protein
MAANENGASYLWSRILWSLAERECSLFGLAAATWTLLQSISSERSNSGSALAMAL